MQIPKGKYCPKNYMPSWKYILFLAVFPLGDLHFKLITYPSGNILYLYYKLQG